MKTNPLVLHHLSQPPRTPQPSGERPPMLLFLHGVGSNETDLFGLAQTMDPRFHVLSLRAPHTVGPDSFAWFEVELSPEAPRINPWQAEASRQMLMRFLEQAPRYYRTDPQRLYLFGFSLGAIMSLALILTQPDILAGAVAIGGRTFPELFEEAPPLGGHLAPHERLKGIPLLVIHGLRDEVLPIHYGRSTHERFSSLPVRLTYAEHDMPHMVSGASLREAASWLGARLAEPRCGE